MEPHLKRNKCQKKPPPQTPLFFQMLRIETKQAKHTALLPQPRGEGFCVSYAERIQQSAVLAMGI